MFRNQYDHDVSVWSPQGRIHQIEYAMEAVKQGSATIGLKNRDNAILVALKRAPSELSSYQKKIIQIDDHAGISIAGLTADGRQLSQTMRNECLNSRWAYDQPLPISRLVSKLAYKMQVPTQRYGRRPFGVGILIAGYDSQGSHVFYQCPSANYYDCKAIAIGARSQSARTYLERNLDSFLDASLDDLIKHGLQALSDTLPNDVQLTSKNCSLALVGKEREFILIEEEAVEPYLAFIKQDSPPAPSEMEQAADTTADPAPAEQQPEPQMMEEEPLD